MARTALSLVLLIASAAGLKLGGPVPTTTTATCSRRGFNAWAGTATVAAAAALFPSAVHAAESKEAKLVRDTLAGLKVIKDDKAAFIEGIIAQDPSAPQLPPAIPFTTFQKLEGQSDPEFMEAAIDYAGTCTIARATPRRPSTQPPFACGSLLVCHVRAAESNRAAKDLVKLAKLTKQKVQVSYKEAGKPRSIQEVEYGDAPGSNLGSTKEYAERAADEVLGTYLALDAAVKAMGTASK